jgi:hypothetical protein
MANRITKVKKLRDRWDLFKLERPKEFNTVIRRINNEQEANRRRRRYG